MTARVIQGSFLGVGPKLAAMQPKSAAPPPIQPEPATRAPGPPATAFGGHPPGPPSPAFAARPPAPAFAARPAAAQRHGVGGAFAVEAGALGLAASGGRALPSALRGKMEAALGGDFSTVRVHVGPQAERIGAIAFTLGSDIYFAPGRYQPDTVHGQQLLGHELAHVVQQRAGRVRNPLGSGLAVVQDHALEAEADRLGQRAAAYRLGIQAKTAPAASQLSAPVRILPPAAAGPGRYRLTAGAGGRPVGSVVVHAGGSRAVEITDLQVSEVERGHGIGRMLVASAAKTGRQLGKSTMTLAAQDNGSGRLMRWYKEMGFAQTGVNRRGCPQLEAPIGRVLFGAAAQPNLPHRGPPPPLTAFGGPGPRPAAASQTTPPPGRGCQPPGMQATKAAPRSGIVQRMEGQLPPGEGQGPPGEAQQNSPFSSLPDELKLSIASYLDLPDLFRLGLANLNFRNITQSDDVLLRTVARFLEENPGNFHHFTNLSVALEKRYPGFWAALMMRLKGQPVTRRWRGGARRPRLGRSPLLSRTRKTRPFVLKLNMPGSGNTLWRVRGWDNNWKDEQKNIPKPSQELLAPDVGYQLLPLADAPSEAIPLASEQHSEGNVQVQKGYYQIRKYDETKRVSENENIAVFTIAGPQELGGMSDSGVNSIENNVNLGWTLIVNFITHCRQADHERPISIRIKAHSRNAVAASIISRKSREHYHGIDITLNLALFDPVPGPFQDEWEYHYSEVQARESTLVYSINSEHLGNLFKPQKVMGAQRVIVSRKNHGVGYHKGFKLNGVTYRGNKLNTLPFGFYISVRKVPESEPEIIEPCFNLDQVTKFLKETISWADLEGRRPIITDVATEWFRAYGGPTAGRRGRGFERKPQPNPPLPVLDQGGLR